MIFNKFLGHEVFDAEEIQNLKAMAKKGYKSSMLLLGVVYADGTYGIEQNGVSAYNWLSRAAKKNEVDAFYYLAGLYAEGLGVMKDEKMARKMYTRFLDTVERHGGPMYDEQSELIIDAIESLGGDAYEDLKGKCAVSEDEAETETQDETETVAEDEAAEGLPTDMKELRMKVRKGDREAEAIMAWYQAKGLHDVQRNMKRGVATLKQLAYEGLPVAMELYGHCMVEGIKMQQSAKRGYNWIMKAKNVDGYVLRSNLYESYLSLKLLPQDMYDDIMK